MHDLPTVVSPIMVYLKIKSNRFADSSTEPPVVRGPRHHPFHALLIIHIVPLIHVSIIFFNVL